MDPASVVTFAAEGVLNKVSALAAQEITLVWGFKADLKKLEKSLSILQDFLVNASEKPKDQSKAVEEWVQQLKDVAEDAENALDEFNYELLRRKVELQNHMDRKVLNFFSAYNPLWFRVKMAHRIKNINKSLMELKKEASFINLVAKKKDLRSLQEREVRDQTNSGSDEVVIGRKDIVNEIVKTLVHSNNEKNHLSVLAIVGMPGLGKTTLAQSVYNTDLISTTFDKRIWMCVSNIFDVDTILNQMVESLAPAKAGLKSQDALIEVLKQELKDKRFILVLDDVWNEEKDKWDSLMNCLSKMGSKTGSCILITTRSVDVASIAETLTRPQLKTLTNDECWSILKQRAWKKEYCHDANRERIGRAIAVKCGGIPLVAKVLGALMLSKATYDEWLSIQNSKIWGQSKESDKVMSILKLSFDNLKSPTLKQCFAYCSMLKKDFKIQKDELVQLWMAQGLLQHVPIDQIHYEMEDTGNEMEDTGNKYFNILFHNSLLQKVPNTEEFDDSSYTMHDLVHDLAIQVSKCDSLIRDCEDTSGVRHVAHVSTSTLENISKNGGRLRSLFSHKPEIAEMNFYKFKSLRVLSLSEKDIHELPNSIGKLKHLRYLDISDTRIKALPSSIGKLYNLQTLRMRNSGLKELPTEMQNMTNLRHLDVSSTGIQALPKSIGKLHNLRTLRMQGNQDLQNLPTEMQNMTNLRHLDVSSTGIRALPESIGKLCKLQTLRMEGNQDLKELPREIQNLKNLRHLYVDEHTKLPDGVLRELTNLREFPCFRVSKEMGYSIEELGGLNKLGGTLTIDNLENVKDEEEAKKAKLQEKNDILGLTLYFKEKYDPTSTMNDEKILEGLQPHSNLQSLTIDAFMGDRFPSWMMKVPLPLINLKQLTLLSCKQCGELPVLGHLPFLGDLKIEEMTRLRSMGTDMYGYDYVYEEARREMKESVVLFPALKTLTIGYCDELSEWKEAPTTTASSTKVVTVFSCLEELTIKGCPKIGFIPIAHGMTSLRLLKIDNCKGLSSNGQLDHCTSLQVLHISRCENLTSVPISQGLPCLRELEISDCNGLSTLSMSGMDNCTSLTVSDCVNLATITSTRVLPALRKFDIETCKNLSSLAVLEYCPSLQELTVTDCPKLEELNPLCHSLDIYGCNGLRSLPDLRNFLSLRELNIRSCSGIERLPYVPVSLVELLISDLENLESVPISLEEHTSLRWLDIIGCWKLKSLPTGLGYLTRLECLELGPFCKELDSFPEFQVPPQLSRLRLRGWNKLKSLPQQLQQLTSLTELDISSFDGVVTLPDWLGNLASLEELQIWNCENLKYLPSLEAMQRLTKLEILEIYNCPLLEERCKKDSGEEWSKISHIPRIQLGRF